MKTEWEKGCEIDIEREHVQGKEKLRKTLQQKNIRIVQPRKEIKLSNIIDIDNVGKIMIIFLDRKRWIEIKTYLKETLIKDKKSMNALKENGAYPRALLCISRISIRMFILKKLGRRRCRQRQQ